MGKAQLGRERLAPFEDLHVALGSVFAIPRALEVVAHVGDIGL